MNFITKTCFKCLKDKSLSEFYRHKRMSDGHLNKCKDCTKSDVRIHRCENDSVREYDRLRGNRQSREYFKEYRKKFPNKYKAHTLVNNYLRDGKLQRVDVCEICNSSYHVVAHHDDYSKPLEVRWLCARCHSNHHELHGEGLNP